MSRTDTWMPLYIADYIADTMRLSTVEHGAYLLLLMEYWRKGPLPNDDKVLAAIARADRKLWAEIGPTIREFFSLDDDGRLHQKRVDEERKKASELSDKRRIAALQRGNKGDTAGRPAPGKQEAIARLLDEHSSGCDPGLHDSLSRDLSPSTKEEVKPSRAYANVGCGLRGMEDATPDPKNGRPTCGGHYLDVCIERVNDAARIDTSRWRGDYRPLMKWLDVEHIDPEIIFRVMKRKSAYKHYQVPTSLSWFKPAIDEELGRKPS